MSSISINSLISLAIHRVELNKHQDSSGQEIIYDWKAFKGVSIFFLVVELEINRVVVI